MGKVRMFHAASNRYQYDAAENFEVFHEPAGWVLAPEEPATVVEEAPVAEPAADLEPEAEATAPARRGARAK